MDITKLNNPVAEPSDVGRGPFQQQQQPQQQQYPVPSSGSPYQSHPQPQLSSGTTIGTATTAGTNTAYYNPIPSISPHQQQQSPPLQLHSSLHQIQQTHTQSQPLPLPLHQHQPTLPPLQQQPQQQVPIQHLLEQPHTHQQQPYPQVIQQQTPPSPLPSQSQPPNLTRSPNQAYLHTYGRSSSTLGAGIETSASTTVGAGVRIGSGSAVGGSIVSSPVQAGSRGGSLTSHGLDSHGYAQGHGHARIS
ncbi:unnamed protein product [Ambrosiozyma monospora]|uniref:Unnamed protein product n=1 Tax=Ambrosiozyma monospora TaxID=43982 RepID=A0ACB5SVK3_AMBMO|nr:unnamed protein product [Ambrosiozyma monospora]